MLQREPYGRTKRPQNNDCCNDSLAGLYAPNKKNDTTALSEASSATNTLINFSFSLVMVAK